MRGEEAGPGLRELLESLLSRLDGLADRPVELSVTTNIDGRKVAEAVYKDLQGAEDQKLRNTLRGPMKRIFVCSPFAGDIARKRQGRRGALPPGS